MRAMRWIGGLVMGLAACGGGKQQGQPAADSAAAAAPAAGATHDINMMLEGTEYKFVPAELSIKAGDKVVFHNVGGGPHNVQFWVDSIPADSRAALDAAMTGDKLGELNGPLLIEPNATYEISFAGMVAGDYRFTCTPHMVNKMNGKITVAP